MSETCLYYNIIRVLSLLTVIDVCRFISLPAFSCLCFVCPWRGPLSPSLLQFVQPFFFSVGQLCWRDPCPLTICLWQLWERDPSVSCWPILTLFDALLWTVCNLTHPNTQRQCTHNEPHCVRILRHCQHLMHCIINKHKVITWPPKLKCCVFTWRKNYFDNAL